MANVSRVVIRDDEDADYAFGSDERLVKTSIEISDSGVPSGVPFSGLPEAHQKALRAYIEGEK